MRARERRKLKELEEQRERDAEIRQQRREERERYLVFLFYLFITTQIMGNGVTFRQREEERKQRVAEKKARKMAEVWIKTPFFKKH